MFQGTRHVLDRISRPWRGFLPPSHRAAAAATTLLTCCFSLRRHLPSRGVQATISFMLVGAVGLRNFAYGSDREVRSPAADAAGAGGAGAAAAQPSRSDVTSSAARERWWCAAHRGVPPASAAPRTPCPPRRRSCRPQSPAPWPAPGTGWRYRAGRGLTADAPRSARRAAPRPA